MDVLHRIILFSCKFGNNNLIEYRSIQQVNEIIPHFVKYSGHFKKQVYRHDSGGDY